VLVHWVEDGQAQNHLYELAWLRAEDVRRFLKTWRGRRSGLADFAEYDTHSGTVRSGCDPLQAVPRHRPGGRSTPWTQASHQKTSGITAATSLSDPACPTRRSTSPRRHCSGLRRSADRCCRYGRMGLRPAQARLVPHQRVATRTARVRLQCRRHHTGEQHHAMTAFPGRIIGYTGILNNSPRGAIRGHSREVRRCRCPDPNRV
jgi:hypothetical protein